MARSKGSASFAGSLEVLAGAPLDARLVVNSKEDLIAATSYPYKYIGMIVSVKSEERAYMLIGNDTTSLDNWKVVGGDSVDVTVYKPCGTILFEDRPELSSSILGHVYDIKDNFTTTVDFVEGAGYEYAAGTNIVVVDVGTEEVPNLKWDVLSAAIDLSDYQEKMQYGTLPMPSEDIVNNIYQYIGATNAYYTNGYFYKCIENPSSAGNYIYVGVNVQDVIGAVKQVSTLPTANASNEGLIVQYIGADSGSLVNGYFYKCEDAGSGSYTWVQKNIQPDNDTSIQVASMPTVSVSDLGRIVQYIGTTSGNYTNGYFYECVEDETTPGTYLWKAISVQEGGGSGSGSLSRAITAAIDVGGIDAGDNFAVGTSYDDMWDALLNPTLYPTFTAPTAALSYSADTYYEVGSTIPAKVGTVSYNAGAITVNGTKQNDRGGSATNYALASTGADTDYSGSSAVSGTFNVSALKKSSKGNVVLTATVSYAQGPQPKDSKGNNYDSPLPAGTVTASKTMQFILPYYYGKSSTSTVSDFTGLTKSVTAKGQKQFKFTTNNEYMVIAYDSSYGNLSSIIDPNGFETISGWTKSTLTVNGFSYYVYVANSATTDTNAQFTFKY